MRAHEPKVCGANPDNVVIPFDDKPYRAQVDPQDSILSLSARLAKYGGGGTNCSLLTRIRFVSEVEAVEL